MKHGIWLGERDRGLVHGKLEPGEGPLRARYVSRDDVQLVASGLELDEKLAVRGEMAHARAQFPPEQDPHAEDIPIFASRRYADRVASRRAEVMQGSASGKGVLRDARVLIPLMDRAARAAAEARPAEHRKWSDQLDAALLQTETLREGARISWQLRAASFLCQGALQQVPFYRDQEEGYRRAVEDFLKIGQTLTFGAPKALVDGALHRFHRIPIIDRPMIQNRTDALENPAVRGQFRQSGTLSSSGSSGRPMKSPRSRATLQLFDALNRRLHRWHRQDEALSAAFIRQPIPGGHRFIPSWSRGRGKGAGHAIDLMMPHTEQLALLIEKKPRYLVTFPSNLAGLLQASKDMGRIPKSLRIVGLMAETVPPDLRHQCERAWEVRTYATYSCSELGPLGFSCPEVKEQYRVMSENVLLEIVDDDGQPCAPGEVGRVVATSLLDPLRPLIRYAVGDYAQAVESFDGRDRVGRVFGRSRNMFVRKDGTSLWPYFRTQAIAEMPEVQQWKLIQNQLGEIVVQLVVEGELSEVSRQRIEGIVLEHLPEETVVRFDLVRDIPRSASGKFEDFESRLSR